MAQTTDKIRNSNACVAPPSPPPSTEEFAEYTATILAELSKASLSYRLPVLAHLMDLARLEAQFHLPRSDKGY